MLVHAVAAFQKDEFFIGERGETNFREIGCSHRSVIDIGGTDAVFLCLGLAVTGHGNREQNGFRCQLLEFKWPVCGVKAVNNDIDSVIPEHF